jgi:hypothetical protein
MRRPRPCQLDDKRDVYKLWCPSSRSSNYPTKGKSLTLTVMLEMLMEDSTLHNLVDKGIAGEANMLVIRQVAELANGCLLVPGTRGPAMIKCRNCRRCGTSTSSHCTAWYYSLEK